ncbi:MAG: hypothetical protein EPN55_12880 [Gammaproteobacteria bacterium]|nr:MAG: hypothetical protein EPN55_12880 [Gammaproteobacteria bacterium]
MRALATIVGSIFVLLALILAFGFKIDRLWEFLLYAGLMLLAYAAFPWAFPGQQRWEELKGKAKRSEAEKRENKSQ